MLADEFKSTIAYHLKRIMMTQDSEIQKTSVDRAYVLIETEAESALQVVESLQNLSNIISVDIINGPYAVIAVVEGSTSTVAKTVAVDIKKIIGVKDVIAFTSVRGQKGASA
jgi:hypothetical protein